MKALSYADWLTLRKAPFNKAMVRPGSSNAEVAAGSFGGTNPVILDLAARGLVDLATLALTPAGEQALAEYPLTPKKAY